MVSDVVVGRTAGRRRWRAIGRAAPWVLAAPGAAWAVARLLEVERGPLVQLLAFTPYAAAWSLVPLAYAVAVRRWWAVGLAAAVALALGACVVPRAVASSTGAPDGPGLRVLTANLLAGAADPAALVALVKRERVDVLTLQELTPEAVAALDRHGIAALLPHRTAAPQPGTSGSGLYARFPLRDTGVRHNEGGFLQAFATLTPPGAAPVAVESVHPAAPYALSVLPDWRADLYGQPAATPDGPVRILAGDFNATLDHAALRGLIATGYRDAADVAGAGLVGTWGPYDGDLIPPVTIDHVLADRRVGVRAVAVFPLPGSDHRPLFAELVPPPA